MSQAVGCLDITIVAGDDLSTIQYHFITLDADGKAVACGANEVSIGILQNTPESGEAARVRVLGTSKLVMNEPVAPIIMITSTTTGAGEVVDGVDEFAGAICLEEATAQNDIIEVLLIHTYVPASQAA